MPEPTVTLDPACPLLALRALRELFETQGHIRYGEAGPLIRVDWLRPPDADYAAFLLNTIVIINGEFWQQEPVSLTETRPVPHRLEAGQVAQFSYGLAGELKGEVIVDLRFRKIVPAVPSPIF